MAKRATRGSNLSSPESARAARRRSRLPGRSPRQNLRSALDAGWPQEPTQTFIPYESVFKDQGGRSAGLSHISGENLGGTAPCATVRRRPRSTFVTEGRGADFSGRRSPCQHSFRSLFRAPRRTGTSRGCSEDRAPALEPSGRRGEAHSSRRFRPVKHFSRGRREIVR